MKIVKRINHNAVICLDSRDREVVALGSGIGFPSGTDDLDVSRVERTFYGLDERYLALLEEIPFEALEFSAQLADVIRGTLPYDLSPNYPLALADHIAFMLKRTREHMPISMPLSYDMAQLYPLEWRLGTFVVERAQKFFGIELAPGEAVGIAMGILSSSDAAAEAARQTNEAEALLEELTRRVEGRFSISIDRAGINYARFATHIHYLLRGVRADAITARESERMLASLKAEVPRVASCAQELAGIIERKTQVHLGTDELVYLIIHVNRLCGAANGG